MGIYRVNRNEVIHASGLPLRWCDALGFQPC